MWELITTDRFDAWYDALNDKDRTNVLAAMLVLRDRGPRLSRPHADTVNGSSFPNMKELRIQSRGKPIRVFYAFDPQRCAILLCGGNKSGIGNRFYREMISMADHEYTEHLKTLQ